MANRSLLGQTEKQTLKGSALWGILLFFLLVLIDQATKFAAAAYFVGAETYERIDVIPNWISLCLSYNPGIAFSMFGQSEGWVKGFITVATAVLMAALIVLYFCTDKRRAWLRNALVFIVAGGVGNLIDRVYYRIWESALYGVRDMVDLSAFGFGICNFADFFIVGGAIALCLAFLFFDTDAIKPIGKYRGLAEEAEARAEAKKAAKREKQA